MMELLPLELARPAPRTMHLFGITQISAMHIEVLRWLGEHVDLRLYHLNPLLGRLGQFPISRTRAREAMATMERREHFGKLVLVP